LKNILPSPLVTIGIPLYNHKRYIEQCLQSLVNQTYKNIEIIIIDDGSPDDSYDIAKQFMSKQNKNKNFIIKTRKNQGMCNTLNEIAKQAQGKYISFIGSDDYWATNKIEEQVEFLENSPHLMLVHSNSIKVDDSNKEIGRLDYSSKKNNGYIFESIIYGKGGINTPSHLYKTEIFKQIGYYDPNFRFEDTDFWLRLTAKFEIGFINKFHTYYRCHGDNMSNSDNMLKFYYEELIKIYIKNIEDPTLRQFAVSKMLRKSYSRALRTVKLKLFFIYLIRYVKCKYFNKCEKENN